MLQLNQFFKDSICSAPNLHTNCSGKLSNNEEELLGSELTHPRFSQSKDLLIERESVINLSNLLLCSKRVYRICDEDINDLMSNEKLKNLHYIISLYQTYLNFVLYHFEVFHISPTSQICSMPAVSVLCYISNLPKKIIFKESPIGISQKSNFLLLTQSGLTLSPVEPYRCVSQEKHVIKSFKMEKQCVRRIGKALVRSRIPYYFRNDLSPLFAKASSKQKEYFQKTYGSCQEFMIFHSDVFSISPNGQVHSIDVPEIQQYVNSRLETKLEVVNKECSRGRMECQSHNFHVELSTSSGIFTVGGQF